MSYQPQDLWTRWQAAVLALLRLELADVLPGIQATEIDWRLWRALFDEGFDPLAAVERAFTHG